MLLNAASIAGLNTGFKTSFQQGVASVESKYQRVATVPPRSQTREERYPFLGFIPSIREWVGDRQVNKLAAHVYAILNKPFELTVEVDRDDIRDDQIGMYAPLMQDLGLAAANFPDQLVFGLLADAWSALGYDGQPLIDTDHLGYTDSGAETSVSNSGGGAGNPWYLMDTRRPLKPMIYQEREPFAFGLVEGSDPGAAVPRTKKLLYGVNGRCNAGVGMWQQVFGSKDTLTAAHYSAARSAMGALRKADGAPMGVRPNLLVVGPSNEGAGRKLLQNQMIDGSDNEWKGTAELLVVEWLP